MDNWLEHRDYKYIKSLSNGKGMAYGFDSINGLATIYYIYDVSYFKILKYNIILYFKWLKRKIRKLFSPLLLM